MPTGRRELTWLACDALAAAGRKPAIASVREWTLSHHGRKQGSDTDTQADINAWYGVLLALKQEQLTVAGLPDDVAQLARSLWLKANEAARDNLHLERAAMDAELQNAQAREQAAAVNAAAAEDRASAAGHALDVARESILRLEQALQELRTAGHANSLRQSAHCEQLETRMGQLLQESIQKDAVHAARLTELDGLRRHALLQIDEARTESRLYKTQAERAAQTQLAALTALQQAAAHSQAELAGALGRLSAVEESLAAAQQHNRILEAALVHARLQDAPTRVVATKRPGTGLVQRAPAFRRRKL